MLACTDVILQRLDVIGGQLARLLNEPVLPAQSLRRLDIPQPIANLLESTAIARYGSTTSIPMAEGIDEVIFYLDRATLWQTRRGSNAQPSQDSKWASLLRAYWLFQATMASDEYQAAVTTISVAELEQQLPRLGMTARRFFSKLEEVSGCRCADMSRGGWLTLDRKSSTPISNCFESAKDRRCVGCRG